MLILTISILERAVIQVVTQELHWCGLIMIVVIIPEIHDCFSTFSVTCVQQWGHLAPAVHRNVNDLRHWRTPTARRKRNVTAVSRFHAV